MKITNGLLQGVKYLPSPNMGGSLDPQYLIMHYTASASAQGAIDWMRNKSAKVSAHLHIARTGEIVQLVPFNRVAWHAGVSEWNGLKGLNQYSIGIELQNTGTQEYTEIQLKAAVEAGKAIQEAYKLKDVLGHSDIAPGRKTDPGKQFPMEWFKEQVMNRGLTQAIKNISQESADMLAGKTETLHTTASLNLRKGPGTNYDVISTLPENTAVNIINTEGDWAHVFICESKLTGFVHKNYLR